MGLAVAGLLTGLGEGLVTRADNDRKDQIIRDNWTREDALQARREALETAHEQFQSTLAANERTLDRQDRATDRENERTDRASEEAARRSDSASDIVTEGEDDEGNAYGVTRKGKTVDFGKKGLNRGRAGSKDDSGLSAGDTRLLNQLKQAHTTVDPMGVPKVDQDAIVKVLRNKGRDDLADLYDQGDSSEVDKTSAEYRVAKQQAQAEADEKDPWGPDALRPDAMKSAYGDKTQAAWVGDRADEIYRSGKGKGKSTPQGAATDGAYKSADDVRSAYRAGKLSKDKAAQILKDQFQFQ